MKSKNKILPIRNLEVKDYFKFTYKKIIVNLILSITLFLILLIFLKKQREILFYEDISLKLFDFLFNIIIYMIFLYPYSCFITLWLFKKERKK